jgi:D-alanyl-D-alanine carboxypeptidase
MWVALFSARKGRAITGRIAAISLLGGFIALMAPDPARADARRAAMVIDANSGAVLYNRDGDAQRHPASLTKMMTLYLLFERIEQGRMSYTTRIKFSPTAAAAPPTKIGIDAGGTIATLDAIKALIVKSANDVAIAIGEHLAGSEAAFADEMTRKARQLGMTATRFRNASGLPDSDQVTTARDMLTLALRLQDDFPRHYPLFATRTFSYDGDTIRTHNTLLGSLDGVDGIKTGYTRMSGYNVVTSWKRGEKHLVGAVFGGASASTRNAEMRTILAIALGKAATTKTRRAAPQLVAETGPPRPSLKAARRAQPVPAAPQVLQPVASTKASPAPVAAAPVAPIAPAAPITVAQAPQTVAADSPRGFEVARVKTIAIRPVPRANDEDGEAPASSATDAPVVHGAMPAAEPLLETRAAPSLRTPPFRQPDLARGPDLAPAAAAPMIEPMPRAEPAPLWPEPTRSVPVTAGSGSAPPPISAALAPSRSIVAPLPAARPARSTAAPAPMATPPVPTLVRGAPPSTFQQQAQNLAAGRSAVGAGPVIPPPVAAFAPVAPPQRLSGPAAPAPATAAGGMVVQIGAYASVADAERQLQAVRGKAGDIVGNSPALTQMASTGGRTVVRARFGGFDQPRASAACAELKRRQIDCLVTRAD